MAVEVDPRNTLNRDGFAGEEVMEVTVVDDLALRILEIKRRLKAGGYKVSDKHLLEGLLRLGVARVLPSGREVGSRERAQLQTNLNELGMAISRSLLGDIPSRALKRWRALMPLARVEQYDAQAADPRPFARMSPEDGAVFVKALQEELENWLMAGLSHYIYWLHDAIHTSVFGGGDLNLLWRQKLPLPSEEQLKRILSEGSPDDLARAVCVSHTYLRKHDVTLPMIGLVRKGLLLVDPGEVHRWGKRAERVPFQSLPRDERHAALSSPRS